MFLKREAVLDYFICNGEIFPTNNMDIFDKVSSKSVYEVIKIIDGIPVFFSEHLKRMEKSLNSLGVNFKKSELEILEAINRLVIRNKQKSINVKLVYDKQEKGVLFLVYFIKSEYPSESSYKKGIHTVLFEGKRKMPNIKTINSSFREQVQEIRKKTGAYEALLIDEEGFIAEGSRSNIFFIKEDELYTPPGKNVLLGVTRKHVMDICKELRIKVKEELIHKNDLKNISGAFITGTTVDILPIRSIDEILLSSTENTKINSIIEAYNLEIKENVKRIQGKLIANGIIKN